MQRPQPPQAREFMIQRVDTLAPDMEIERAVKSLLTRRHSGAPVVDSKGQLLGVLSEYDCVRLLAEAAYEGWPMGHVSDYMTRDPETVSPDDDLFALAQRFAQGQHRRLLVTEEGRLVGLISRRDLLRALELLAARQRQASRSDTYEEVAERRRRLDRA